MGDLVGITQLLDSHIDRVQARRAAARGNRHRLYLTFQTEINRSITKLHNLRTMQTVYRSMGGSMWGWSHLLRSLDEAADNASRLADALAALDLGDVPPTPHAAARHLTRAIMDLSEHLAIPPARHRSARRRNREQWAAAVRAVTIAYRAWLDAAHEDLHPARRRRVFRFGRRPAAGPGAGRRGGAVGARP